MFTGIIESLAKISSIQHEKSNVIFKIQSDISSQLKVDQSLAHNGVCLTVTEIQENEHWVTAIDETMKKTNLSSWKVGNWINLERCMPANGRFDGHFVQGHVDQIGVCSNILDENGSWRYTIEYDPKIGNFTVEKGSICVNGISLTVIDSQIGKFSVAIIPYTYEHTNFKGLQIGDQINLEFDVFGKYLKQMLAVEKYLKVLK
ncbi:MAG: riboflavin synthase [Bacteroidetes bacterium]|nr:MAG: riboflavin synthase [Bacteroidota bacterium]